MYNIELIENIILIQHNNSNDFNDFLKCLTTQERLTILYASTLTVIFLIISLLVSINGLIPCI